MELEQDSGYICCKCYSPILESDLLYDTNYNFYHKGCKNGGN